MIAAIRDGILEYENWQRFDDNDDTVVVIFLNGKPGDPGPYTPGCTPVGIDCSRTSGAPERMLS